MQTMKGRWAPATIDSNTFLCSLEGAWCEETVEEKPQDLTPAIMAACDASIVKKVNPSGRLPVHW